MTKDGDLSELVLISSSRNTSFARSITEYLNHQLIEVEQRDFNDADILRRIEDHESVRGKRVVLISTHEPPIPERMYEANIWLDVMVRGEADDITIIFPYFPGARQDRKRRRGEPINIVANINNLRGTAHDQVVRLRFMTADLHSAQSQALATRFDNLSAMPLFI